MRATRLGNLQSKIQQNQRDTEKHTVLLFACGKNTFLFIFKLIWSLSYIHSTALPVQDHSHWSLDVCHCTPFACYSWSAPSSTFWPKRMFQLDNWTYQVQKHTAQHHKAAHFHSSQHFSLLPGPLQMPFTHNELGRNPTDPEHEKQTKAGTITP